jgi:hypothetical protein
MAKATGEDPVVAKRASHKSATASQGAGVH